MWSRVRRRCHGVWWFSVGIVVILSLGGVSTSTASPEPRSTGNLTSFTIPWSPTVNHEYTKAVSVVPGQSYNFTVSARSDSFTGEIDYKVYTAPCGPPPLPQTCVVIHEECPNSAATSAPMASLDSTSSFSVEFSSDFFTDSRNGEIIDYGLIVVRTDSEEINTASTNPGLSVDHFENYANWYAANEKAFVIPYRATPREWSYENERLNRSRRETDQSLRYIIGTETDCTEMKDVYCNGPLQPDKDYSVSAFSCTSGGCAQTEYIGGFRTSQVPEPDISDVTTIAVSVSCTLLLVILIAVIVFLVLRHRNRAPKNRTPTEVVGSSHLPMSDYETVNSTTNGKEEKTYEDMRYGQMAISDSRIALFTENMSKGKQEVVRGTFMETNGQYSSIAVHKIKGTRPFERCKAEVDIMRNIGSHPNVVSFLGYSLKDDNTVLMIHCYEDNRDLQSFLSARGRVGGETGLTEASLLNFAQDVALGMAHLARLGILHEDLRAHNILLAGNLTAKVAGLQQARPVGAESKTLSKFPMSRWASIETLEHQIYTSWSEIWSFGVLMWEIMTYGATPYGEMTSKEILNLLRQDCGLTCPKSCQPSFYRLLFDCWNRQPEERPTFEFLSQRLASMVTDVQQYLNIGVYETLDFAPGDIENSSIG